MLWVPSIPDQVNINHTSCTKNVNFNLDFNKSIFNLFHDLLKVPVIHINNFKVQLISINWTICRIFFWLVCLNNQTSRWSLFCRIRFYPISPITCKCVPRYFYKIFLIHNILRFSSLYFIVHNIRIECRNQMCKRCTFKFVTWGSDIRLYTVVDGARSRGTDREQIGPNRYGFTREARRNATGVLPILRKLCPGAKKKEFEPIIYS